MKIKQGFTLIEIVVVIVLIGILSAVALPRFYDFTGQATEAATEGVKAAMSSSIGMTQASWLAQGKPSSITLDNGKTMYLNGKGYPVGSTSTTKMTASGCQFVLENLLSDNSVRIGSIDEATALSSGAAISSNYDYVAYAASDISTKKLLTQTLGSSHCFYLSTSSAATTEKITGDSFEGVTEYYGLIYDSSNGQVEVVSKK